MNNIVVESQYLPSIEFFCAAYRADKIQIEIHEHYVKQSYRNHAFIVAANGVVKLVVPLTAKGNRVPIRDVKIDDGQNWRNNQWRTIESAYRNSPYFEHYADDLKQIITGRQIFLIDLNFELLTMILDWLGLDPKLTRTSEYQERIAESFDLRNRILSKKPYTGRNIFEPVAYKQVFGETFAANVSVIDLIFCVGPHAINIIRASRAEPLM